MSNKLGIDLSKFKHVKSDDKSTTLQHKDGHVMTIAHNVLAPKHQDMLKALATQASASETPDQQQEADSQYGKVIMKADGGSVNPSPPTVIVGQSQDTPPPVAPSNKDKQRAVSKGAAEGESIPSAGTLVDRLKNAWAEGGQQGPAEPLPDVANVAGAVSTPPQAQPEVPKEKVEVQKLYNQIVGDKLGDMMSAHDGSGSEAHPSLFGPNGQPPQAFDADAYSQAEQQAQTQQVDAAGDSQKQAAKIDADNQVRARAGLPPIAVPGMNTPDGVPADQPKPPTEPQQNSQSQAQAPSDSMGASMQDAQGLLNQGYQNKLQGINQEAQAVGDLGKAQADLANKNLQAQQDAQISYKQQYDQLEAERQNHMHDIEQGYIDPKKYWDDHSKIASGIGMILAGFNPTTAPNAAVNFLKYQMEQNLNAQKENLGAKQSLLAANLRQFGNLREATDMTRLMQSDILQNELNQAAMTAKSPLAKAAALQASGQLKMDYAPLQQNMAMRQSMIKLANGGANPASVEHTLAYMRVLNPEMAKEMETRYVPGVGLAATPVPQGVRDQLVAKQQFGNAVQDLQQWAMHHSGSLSPSDIAEGRTKSANVQNLYRQGINGGVFKQGEQSFINGIIDSDPTKFFNNIRVLPKLNEAARENEQSLNILKKGSGLPVPQQPAAPQIKTVNGVKYMRGPNGQAIKVK